ncbi:RusA family crossover junction endodeoxyribonuclease [Rhodococcus globerulus]|uniref:RusA family crossover junction endodeoxyribonuclease n=1 Tax=Rhodococcus globerulus TaxID=33008 RepID=UPI0039EA741E
MNPRIEFFVPGAPAPQGSKRHVGHGRMIESSKAVGPWRERVALAAHSHADGLIGGPIGIRLKFVMPRPKSAPKRTTPPAIKRPDIDKISRAILDAITGVLIADDSQVTDLHATKRIAEINENHGVHIELTQLHEGP